MITPTAPIYAVVARDCLCRKARMADRTITRAYDEALRPSGLRITQFTLLVAIGYGAPGSIGELADWLAMERTTLTRNLKLLEKDGLITTRAGAHHRSRVAELTASGRTRLEQAYPLWQAVQAEYRECLGSEGWRESHGALTRLATVDR
jgi:DNA-binding MarR family transcriptional regulator